MIESSLHIFLSQVVIYVNRASRPLSSPSSSPLQLRRWDGYSQLITKHEKVFLSSRLLIDYRPPPLSAHSPPHCQSSRLSPPLPLSLTPFPSSPAPEPTHDTRVKCGQHNTTDCYNCVCACVCVCVTRLCVCLAQVFVFEDTLEA